MFGTTHFVYQLMNAKTLTWSSGLFRIYQTIRLVTTSQRMFTTLYSFRRKYTATMWIGGFPTKDTLQSERLTNPCSIKFFGDLILSRACGSNSNEKTSRSNDQFKQNDILLWKIEGFPSEAEYVILDRRQSHVAINAHPQAHAASTASRNTDTLCLRR